MLSGYKTYIVGALLGVTAAAEYLNFIDADTGAQLRALLLGGGLITLRAGVKTEVAHIDPPRRRILVPRNQT
jgi:hypothetical protein